jgi:SAM-dependent methyltransferase
MASAGWSCPEPTCSLAQRGPFPTVGDWPVLVDFEHSVLVETAVRSTAGASAISRSDLSGLKKRLKDLLFPPNRVARRQTATMREALLSREKNKENNEEENNKEDRATNPTLLVIGGGSIGSGVEALYADETLNLIGFDIYGTPHTQFIADTHQIPLQNESVDAVLIQAVLEHVLQPALVVEEIYRVLKPQGLVYAETPFMQQVHEGPYDFTRFTESGHRYLFRKFERMASGAVAGPGTQLLWTIDHVARGLFRSAQVGKAFRVCFFWVQYLDRIIPPSYSCDDASAVYFLGKKSEHTLQPPEIIAHYQGAQ